jgi:murein DD-endopeptidase MepM/ murein hydrolase activator NlpD
VTPRVLVVLLLALLVAAPAAADTITKKRQVDAKIESLSDKIAAARAREQQLAGEIAGLTSRIRRLEAEVGDVSRDLAALEQDLALQQEKLNRVNELLRLQTEKLGFLREQHDGAVDRLSTRIVEIYQSGNVSTVEVLLDSKNFGELISRLDYARELAHQDARIADSVGRAKVRMREAQTRTALTRKQVRAAALAVAYRTQQARTVRNQLIAQEGELSRTRGSRRETLEDVQQTKEAYLDEVRALAAVSNQLAAQIRGAQSSTASAPVVPSGGGFMWPVSGPVTSPFGWRWGRMHQGIDIAVPTGTPVVASNSGRVIYAGWMGGYGNLVVVDHGGGVATAYGHNSSIAAGNGQSVGQGQVIAYAGSTGNSTGPHVHFEVRVNGSPVDPLGYLG